MTTAKDAVKLPSDTVVWTIEISVEPIEGSWNGLWRMVPEIKS